MDTEESGRGSINKYTRVMGTDLDALGPTGVYGLLDKSLLTPGIAKVGPEFSPVGNKAASLPYLLERFFQGTSALTWGGRASLVSYHNFLFIFPVFLVFMGILHSVLCMFNKYLKILIMDQT